MQSDHHAEKCDQYAKAQQDTVKQIAYGRLKENGRGRVKIGIPQAQWVKVGKFPTKFTTLSSWLLSSGRGMR